MFHIYQIEDVRLFDTIYIDNKNTVDRSLETYTKIESIAWTPKKIFGYAGSAVKTKPIRITEPLLNSDYTTIDNRISEYNRLMGYRLVNVIGYIYEQERRDDLTGRGLNSSYDLSERNPIWVYNTGRIMKTEISDDQIITEIELQPQWEPLNRYYWRFGTNILYYENQEQSGNSADDLNALPLSMDIFNRNFTSIFNHINYTNDFFMLDADRWEAYHDRLPLGYLPTGQSFAWTNDNSFTVNTDTYFWTTTPKSFYQFRNLQDLGGITMQIDSPEGGWGRVARTCILNLNLLDVDLASAGYTGLLEDDIVYIADYQGMITFVRRGDTIIRDAYPRWIFNTETLGQLGLGLNTINIQYTNASNKECAMLHIFRIA